MQNVYEQYTAVDFVSDNAFLAHHLSPTAQSAHFWEHWLQRYPQQRQAWQEAQQLLEAVRLGLSEYARTYLSAEAEAQLLMRIQATNSLPEKDYRIIPLWRVTWFGQVAAACLLIGTGIGVWLLAFRTSQQSVYQQQVATLRQKSVEQTNQTQVPQSIKLPDGSAMLLYPQSRLSYPADFGWKNRIVYLLGKASFDVVKNTGKPFYVYANELITRVLGTRFTVEAFEKSKDVIITVQHGRVNVYPNESLSADNAGPQPLKGVLILPNQQLVFSRKSEQFTKKIVAEPAILELDSPRAEGFVFDETPVADAFERIKRVYGINIVYNADDLRNCQLTASLADESLFQKLDIITQSIGANYQLIDGEIVIIARGCSE